MEEKEGRIIESNPNQQPSGLLLSRFLGFLVSKLRKTYPLPDARLPWLLLGAVLIELPPEDCVNWGEGEKEFCECFGNLFVRVLRD